MYKAVKVSDVKAGKNWSRQTVRDITSLKESLRRFGLKQPIIVDAELNLIAGFRRLKAATELGWEEIDAKIEPNNTDGPLINLMENLERESLTFYDEACAVRDLFEGLSEQQVADMVGRSRGWSRPRIRLWELPEGIIELVKQDKLTPTQVRNLLNSSDTEEASQKVIDGGKIEPQSTRPGKKEIQSAITTCLEREMLDVAQSLRWVLGDITEEEFWDNVQKD